MTCSDMLNKFVFVNLDDFLILSKSCKKHYQTVLQRLLEVSLFVMAKDFHFTTRLCLSWASIVQESMQWHERTLGKTD